MRTSRGSTGGAAIWVFRCLIGMGIISFFGQFGAGGILGGVGTFSTVLVGGNSDIPLYVDLLILAVFSLVIYYLAIAKRLPEADVDHYVREVYPPPVAE